VGLNIVYDAIAATSAGRQGPHNLRYLASELNAIATCAQSERRASMRSACKLLLPLAKLPVDVQKKCVTGTICANTPTVQPNDDLLFSRISYKSFAYNDSIDVHSETALADSYGLIRLLPNVCLFDTILPLQQYSCLCSHISTFGSKMKIWHQCFLLPPRLRVPTSHTGEPEIIKLKCNSRSSYISNCTQQMNVGGTKFANC
jgi:hypothetical protein